MIKLIDNYVIQADKRCYTLAIDTGKNNKEGKKIYKVDAPFDVSDVCCNYLKKEPAHRYSKETGKKAILGIMAEESEMRKDQWMKHGCNAFDLKHPQSS